MTKEILYREFPESLRKCAWIEHHGIRTINLSCEHGPNEELRLYGYNDQRGLYEIEEAAV